MSKIKIVLVALLALGLSHVAVANLVTIQRQHPLVESRSYGTDTYSACVTLGVEGAPNDDWIAGKGFAKTSGSSTTVTAVTASANTFLFPNTGDSIRFLGGRAGNKPLLDADSYRQIATNADNDTITVNRAVDLDPTAAGATAAGYRFVFRSLSCSTAAGASYYPLGSVGAGNFLLVAESESGATGGLDYKLEARVHGGAAQDVQIITTGNITQAIISGGLAGSSINLGQFDFGTFGWDEARVMVKVSAGSVVYSVYFSERQ